MASGLAIAGGLILILGPVLSAVFLLAWGRNAGVLTFSPVFFFVLGVFPLCGWFVYAILGLVTLAYARDVSVGRAARGIVLLIAGSGSVALSLALGGVAGLVGGVFVLAAGAILSTAHGTVSL